MLRNKKIELATYAVISILLAASLTGCKAETPEPSLVGPAELPPEEPPPAEETSIVIVIRQDPNGFNGLLNDTGYESAMGELVMLSLTDIDAYGNIFPELATEVPTLENGRVIFDAENNNMTVYWTLRDDVYWADGKQVTVDDVIFTWEAIIDEEMGSRSEGYEYTEWLERVDDYSFKVHYYEEWPFPAYQIQFGGENFFVYPEHYCDITQGFSYWECNRQPLSSGPYILEEWVSNDHLTFVRNPNYFEEGKPGIDKVIVQIVSDGAVRKAMMLEGDADADMWPRETAISEYEAASNVYVSFSPTERRIMRLIPNLAQRGTTDSVETPHPILSDVLVRRAIRMAIDIDTITDEVFLGYGKPLWTEFFRDPYKCDIPRPEYDITAAEALLVEAGWTDANGDGLRECHGCLNADEGYEMEIEIQFYAEYGEELEIAAQLIEESLEGIGFEITTTMVEGTLLWAPYADGGIELNGDFDLDLWDDGYPGTDPTDSQVWTYYHSDAADPESGGFNVGRWMNEDLDLWYDELFYMDEEYRHEVFCEMALILEDELPQILLWSSVEATGFSSRIVGGQSSTNDLFTWNIADWTLTGE